MNANRPRTLLAASVTALVLAVASPGAQAPAMRAAHHAPSAVPISMALGTPAAQDFGDQAFRFRRLVIRVGQDYTLRRDEEAGGVRSVFGNLTLEGHVDRDVVVVLGTVRVASTAVVEGSLVVLGGSATIDRGATVGHDLVVVGGPLSAPADFSPGGEHVVIGSPAVGDALNAVVPWITRGLLWGRPIVPDLGWLWVVIAIVFFVYLVVNTIFDRSVRAAADATLARPLSVFLVGLLVLVLTIPIIAILAVTVVGLAVVPFVLCAMLVAGLVGKAGVARALGRAIVAQSEPESKLQSLRSFVLGTIVIGLAYMVPILGGVTWALTSVLAVGAAAAMLRGALRREHPPRERVVVVPPIAPAAVQPPAAAPAPSVVQTQPAATADVAAAPGPDTSSGGATPGGSTVTPPAGDLTLFPRATFLDRVAAFALDGLLVGIVSSFIDGPGRHHDGMFPLLLLAYHVAFWAWKGTTLGGIVVGLRVVRIPATADMRFVDALVRGLASIFSLLAFGIGCFWMLQDAERQMWHDKIAGTVVVKVPRSLALA